jgi:microcystin degradation protein MlrC
MNAFAFAQEADVPGVLDCTVFHGFFKSDTQHVGVHVVCTVDLNSPGVSAALAQKTACSVGSWVWERRDRFRQSNLSPTDAVAEAAALSEKNGTKGRSSGGPVVLHEISDNPGSGAPGNATHLLRALVDAGQSPRFQFFFDS